MKRYDLSGEYYRTYIWVDPISTEPMNFTIEKPIALFYEKGHSCHRVLDADGVVTCLPAVGYFGCTVSWKSINESEPVRF